MYRIILFYHMMSATEFRRWLKQVRELKMFSCTILYKHYITKQTHITFYINCYYNAFPKDPYIDWQKEM